MIPPDLPVRTLAECGAAEAAAALNACFDGYLVPVRMDAVAFERRQRAEHLDPFASRLYGTPERPAALLLVDRRGWSSRVGALALAPAYRGRGLGRLLMQTALDEAAARGDRRMGLEVFEQNAPALALYRSLGFKPLRRLYGYGWTPAPGEADPAMPLQSADPLGVARAVALEGEVELPWVLQAETLAASAPPVLGFSLDGVAHALVRPLGDDRMGLLALVVAREQRRRGLSRCLLQGLAARFPGQTWIIPQIVPEALGEPVLPRLGWKRLPLNQLEMWCELPA